MFIDTCSREIDTCKKEIHVREEKSIKEKQSESIIAKFQVIFQEYCKTDSSQSVSPSFSEKTFNRFKKKFVNKIKTEIKYHFILKI